MGTYDEECLEVFLKMQTQLFRQEVESNMEEAEEFLEDCMAVVCENIEEVKEYLEESGMDVAGMSDQEIEEASEVFPLSDHRYLIVEGQRNMVTAFEIHKL